MSHTSSLRKLLGLTVATLALTAASAGSAEAACYHLTTEMGIALEADCNACAANVCSGDAYCCDGHWDEQCVTEAEEWCDFNSDFSDVIGASLAPGSEECPHGGVVLRIEEQDSYQCNPAPEQLLVAPKKAKEIVANGAYHTMNQLTLKAGDHLVFVQGYITGAAGCYLRRVGSPTVLWGGGFTDTSFNGAVPVSVATPNAKFVFECIPDLMVPNAWAYLSVDMMALSVSIKNQPNNL